MPDSQNPDTELQQRAKAYLLRQRAQKYLGFQGEAGGSMGQSFGASNLSRELGYNTQTKKEQAIEALKMVPPAALAAFGGSVMAPLGVAGTVAGEMLGTNMGMRLTGSDPQEAAIASLMAGGAGLGVQGSMNLTTRGLGSLGGVETPAIKEALRGNTRQTVFGKPSEVAEQQLGQEIFSRLKPKNVGITEGRIGTQQTLAALESKGAKVSIQDTINHLDDVIAGIQNKGVGPDAAAALRKLKGIRKDLGIKYLDQGRMSGPVMSQTLVDKSGKPLQVGYDIGQPPRVAIDPREADYINQQIQDAVGNAFGKPGGKEVTRELKTLSGVHTQSFREQTGTQATAAQTKARLDAIDAMRKQITESSPESFVRSVGTAIMTHGEQGDQSALAALRQFDPGGKLEGQITRLAAKREWTASQSRSAHNVKWEVIRRIPRFMAKLTAVSAKPAGISAAAATAAFSRAMENP